MRRFLFFFLAHTVLYSTPVGNPALPTLLLEGFFVSDQSWCNPQTGVLGDYMIQKRLRPCHASERIGLHRAAIQGTSVVGTVTWNIRERFNVQIELGSGQFNWRWEQVGGNLVGQSRGGLLWSGDAKLIILEAKDTALAIDAKAGGWDWTDGPATANGTAVPHMTHSHLRFWQVGAALTQRISLFAPYIGFAVNRTRFKVTDLPQGAAWMHARHDVGPFGGCSISTGSRFLMNLEWRGWFEEGVSLSALVRF